MQFVRYFNICTIALERGSRFKGLRIFSQQLSFMIANIYEIVNYLSFFWDETCSFSHTATNASHLASREQ